MDTFGSVTSSTIDYDVSSISSNSTESGYLWADKSDGHKIIEIIYLTVLAATGTLGNLTVIFSIILEHRIHSNGNVFVMNLAFADLLVTGFVVPTVIANVVFGGNALPPAGCFVAGYIVTVTCTCSLCNLTFIAINRYYAVVRSSIYKKTFTRKKVYLMVAGTWIWSNLLSFPTFLGWSRIAHDEKMELCSWDDTYSYSYTVFLVCLAVLLPLGVITFCYVKLFTTVRSSGKWVRGLSGVGGVSGIGGNSPNPEQKRRSLRKERNLLQTLATTVAFFCICWLPYGFAILIDTNNTIKPLLKKSFGWLGLTNSGVNFVIYGLMNPVFRQGYLDLFNLVFGCKSVKRRDSNVLHGFNSDSVYRSGNRKRSSTAGTPLSQIRGLNVISANGSNGNLRHILISRSKRVWTSNRRTWYPTCKAPSTIFPSAPGTPQLTRNPTTPLDNGKTLPVKKDLQEQTESINSDTQVKLPSSFSESFAALKRPSTLFKREKNSVKKSNELEEKQIRCSLMLLQLQLADEIETGAEPRRSKSENRSGARNSQHSEKQRSSSVCDAAMFATKDKSADSQSARTSDNDIPSEKESKEIDLDPKTNDTTVGANRKTSEVIDFIREPTEINIGNIPKFECEP